VAAQKKSFVMGSQQKKFEKPYLTGIGSTLQWPKSTPKSCRCLSCTVHRDGI